MISSIRLNRKRRHAGYTLIEMLLVLSIISFLSAVSVKWLYESLQFFARTNELQKQHQVLSRLEDSLRKRARDSVSMSRNEQSLTLDYPDGTITIYTIEGQQVFVRTEADSKIVSRDRFDLGQNANAVWDDKELSLIHI